MSGVTINTGMDFPNLPGGSRIHNIVGAGLRRAGTTSASPFQSPLWDQEFWGLHHSGFFRSLSDESRYSVLMSSSRSLLEEALYIEQNGMAFAAKMSLLAETVEERMLYGLFAAEAWSVSASCTGALRVEVDAAAGTDGSRWVLHT